MTEAAAVPKGSATPKANSILKSPGGGEDAATLEDASPARTSSRGHADTVEGVRITHPDRVLFAEAGVTKLELAQFYQRIAPWLMPHLENRILTLVRCPEGAGSTCFYQKHALESFPRSIHRRLIKEDAEEARTYVHIDTLPGVIAMVQMGVLELHTWGSRQNRLERPDRMIFDLDPDPDVSWDRVVEASLVMARQLADLGLVSFVKTTGGKGLHIVVPLEPVHRWDVVKEFSHAVAREFEQKWPTRYVSSALKSQRKGRIFIDYLRNTRGATAVAAYSTRARPGAPVSVPIRWEELGAGVRPDSWNVRTLEARLRSLERDPWEEYDQVEQRLTPAMKKAVGMK